MSTNANARMTHYIAAFLRRYHASVRCFTVAELMTYLQWFISHRRIVCVTEGSRLRCVALFRRVSGLAEARKNCFSDSDGPIVFVDLVAASAPNAMKSAFNLFRRTFGNRATHISWERGKYNDRYSVYSMNTAERHLSYG